MIRVFFLLIFLSGCSFVGPLISTGEEKRAQAILMMEAQAWQKKQEQRIIEIATRLIGSAETVEPLKFYFAARPYEGFMRVNADQVSAWTDGEAVWITRGMMRFLKNDDELALVLAHEMAHAYQGHIAHVHAKQVLQTAVAAVAEMFAPGSGRAAIMLIDIAAKKFDRDQEREADLYSLVWAHQAGFDVTVVTDLWRRMAIEIPESVESGFLSSHPSSAERLLSLERYAGMLKQGHDASQIVASAKARYQKNWYSRW
jgi:predicted Zn-dependent protease